MVKGLLIVATLAIVVGGTAYYIYEDFDARSQGKEPEIVSPLAKIAKESVFGGDKYKQEEKVPDTELATKDILNILLLGIDRRSKAELGFRTDIMVLVSVNKNENKVVMTSVPRDLWYDGGRINAVYNGYGWETTQDAFEEITGMRPDKYILTDFEDFSWLVDEMGGVEVNVETTFTDSLYPVDATKEYQTISFTQGPEKLTGERALIFSRSRKGDNDNGDWGRMRRQHLILKSIVDEITDADSFLCNFTDNQSLTGQCDSYVTVDTITKSLSYVTTGRMNTNLNVMDLDYLWDFYKDKDSYAVESVFMDYEYVYSPPLSEYGGAWVLVPIGKDYASFHQTLKEKLNPSMYPKVDVSPDNVSEPAEVLQ